TALLGAYTGQEDVVVGTLAANRGGQQVEGLVGLFTNTVVLRSDLSGNPTFRELLERVRTVAIEAYAHQEVPFEWMWEYMEVSRGLPAPLFHVLFVMEAEPNSDVHFSGLELSAIPTAWSEGDFDFVPS